MNRKRELFKLLSTAGVTGIFWKKPIVDGFVLPAHAVTTFNGICESDQSVSQASGSSYLSQVAISSREVGVLLRWTLTLDNVVLDSGSLTDTVVTTESGNASINTPPVTVIDSATDSRLTVTWSFDNPEDGVEECSQSFATILPVVETVSITGEDTPPARATFIGNVVSEGSFPVTARGFVWASDPSPDLSDAIIPHGSTGLGQFSSPQAAAGTIDAQYYGKAYATSLAGTSYGAAIAFTPEQCLIAGTLITLSDGSTKKIQDITYTDRLAVWNFDYGKMDYAYPLWIRRVGVSVQYNLTEYSDGSHLKTIKGHRVFNKEAGMFTYADTEDSPIGTTTVNARGEEVTLVSKCVVDETVSFYNVITNQHINLFANGLLTSSRYNNIYPIVDMKFVKDDRELVPLECYASDIVDTEYYDGMRLAEQQFPIFKTIEYISRMKRFAVDPSEMAEGSLEQENKTALECELVA